MSITSGFFNSVDGDRLYNADQMSTYFKGLIGQGVFNSVGGALQVVASDDFTVDVKTGRAIIGDALKWMENDAVYNLTVAPAHVTLNRYLPSRDPATGEIIPGQYLVIQCDLNGRDITITTKDGSYATNPTKPPINDVAGIKELCLAYIYIKAGATAITQSVILDTRSDSSVCGWVTGLIDQIDTEDLFDQWTAAYEENITEMEGWEVEQKTAFEAWMETLTSQLTVGAYINQYEKTVTLTSEDSRTIPLDMAGYTQSDNDKYFIYLNGLKGIAGTDYTIGTGSITVSCDGDNDEVNIVVLKAVLGEIYEDASNVEY